MSEFPNEDILPDDYPIYGDYLYVADGKPYRSDWHGVTVKYLKAKEGFKEVRRCNIYARQDAATIAQTAHVIINRLTEENERLRAAQQAGDRGDRYTVDDPWCRPAQGSPIADDEARDNLRLIDHIADKIGLSHDDELSQENFNRWFRTSAQGPLFPCSDDDAVARANAGKQMIAVGPALTGTAGDTTQGDRPAAVVKVRSSEHLLAEMKDFIAAETKIWRNCGTGVVETIELTPAARLVERALFALSSTHSNIDVEPSRCKNPVARGGSMETDASTGDAPVASVSAPLNELDTVRALLREKPSTSYVQRKMQIGFNKAMRLIETLEDEGFVSRPDSAGRRTVLVTSTQPLPPDWKQDQSETSRMAPKSGAKK